MRHFLILISLLLLAGILFPVPLAAAPAALDVLRVTPEGSSVPATRQIVIEFNRPVVPLGRMDRTAEEVGITITPSTDCAWRWLSASSLACNLDDSAALQPATRYQIDIGTKITAQDGGSLAAPATYDFTTQRPAVEWASFQTWRGPGSPEIRLVFNQPVSKSSAEAHLFLSPSTAPKTRIPLLLRPDEGDREAPEWLPLPGEKSWISFESVFSRRSDDRRTTVGGEEARRIWIAAPPKPLPLDSSFSMGVEPGLVSALGPERGEENRDIVTFETFPEFRFSGVQCANNAGQIILITPDTPSTPENSCDPMVSVSMAFSSPVLRSTLRDTLDFTPDLAGKSVTDEALWGGADRDWSRLDQPHTKDALYLVSLPVWLKAAQKYTVRTKAADHSFRSWLKHLAGNSGNSHLTDEFGRALPAPLDLTFSTNHRRPNFEIIHRAAVLEKNTDSEVPLYVNNMESVTLNYRRVTAGEAEEGKTFVHKIPAVQDVQFAVPFGIRDLLDGKSGAVYGFLQTQPMTLHGDHQRRFFAQVTPWQVHLKLGHFRSLAWVTDLSSGKPVPGVTVSMYTGSLLLLSAPETVLASSVTDANGLAFLPGTDRLDPRNEMPEKWEDSETRIFLRAQQNEDIAILPVSNEFSVDLWSISDGSVYADTRARYHHVKAWGMSAQGIYRVGDTIQYKIYVRGQDNRHLTPPPALRYALEIRDPMGNSVASIQDVHLSSFGAYSGEFPVPKTAPVGWYDFFLTVDSSSGGSSVQPANQNPATDGEDSSSDPEIFTISPLRVLVSDFTPAPFRVSSEIAGTHFRPGERMDLGIAAKLHSGGAYPDAAARLTVQLRARTFSPETPLTKNFTFDSFNGNADAIQILQKDGALDDSGQWKESLTVPEESIVYGTLSVEGAVQDDRGKSVAARASADYTGVDRMVGLRSPQWIYETGKPVAIETLVVDDLGAPRADVPISIIIEREVVTVAKVKGAGNAYLNEATTEWKEDSRCALTSSAGASVPCAFTPAQGGAYRMNASIVDTKGRPHKTVLNFWVTGSDYVQWDDQSETALPIIPEKKAYKVGETARYLVKNPWPGAQALITVERYGVIDSFVKTLEGGAPVIEIPVKPDYLPGFYLSVQIFSPRVESPPPQIGQIDMGKPAFRVGYVSVPVIDPYKEISVDVKVEQPVYRPGETVRVNLQAAPRNPPETSQPMEMAVAVLDESVFDLIASGQSAFDPYTGFNQLDGLDLRNYSLLTRLVGRQKFEKKGENPGGDGGADLGMRNIFKFVSYWNPSIPTDSQGRAQIEFKVPDNLTGWRILAMAVTPGDRMGLGEGTFKVNRPTELRPVMPNQIREGDMFQAGFSIMNRTDSTRTIRVDIEASGDIRNGKSLQKSETLTLAPYKRASVFFPLESGLLSPERDRPEGLIVFRATAGDLTDSDGITYTLPVLKSRIFEVGALYGTTTRAQVKEPISFPANIYTDSGDLSLTLSPSVIGNLEGAFRYLRDYPYPCWEQLLTRAVVAAQYKNLKPWMDPGFTWKDADLLPSQILARATEFQAPGGGMSYFLPQDSYADPYLSAYTALAFAWMRADGYAVPEAVEAKLDAYLLTFLRKDVAPDFYQEGMSSTVRAVALDALAQNGKIGKEDIERYRPHVPRMDLFGKAHFLMAALRFEGTDDLTRETVSKILSSGTETAGKFLFNQTYDDGYERILASPLRDNCAILSAFSLYATHPQGQTLIGDKAFRLLRGITQSRGSRDHWENTQENVFCLNAITAYARANESLAPDMNVKALLDTESLGTAAFRAFTDAPVSLVRPIVPQDPGRSATLSIDRAGQGRLYYAARLRYAPKDSTLGAVNAGVDIRREYSIQKNGVWSLLPENEPLRRGDTLRVDLYLSLPAARNFLVVDDPIPAGLEPVNRDLATASGVDADAAIFNAAGGSFWFKYTDWMEYGISRWSFYHQELRHDSARFYADYLPPGNYHLSYVAQAVAEGRFAALPARAEEMYDPDVYGRSAGGILSVNSADKPDGE